MYIEIKMNEPKPAPQCEVLPSDLFKCAYLRLFTTIMIVNPDLFVSHCNNRLWQIMRTSLDKITGDYKH